MIDAPSDGQGGAGPSSSANDGLAALTTAFLERGLHNFQALLGAETLDLDALAVSAHRLLGAGGAYGYPALSQLAGELEGCVTHGGEARIRAAGQRLVAEFERLLAQIA